MNSKLNTPFYLLAILLCGAAAGGIAYALDNGDVLELRQEGKILPFERILQSALKQHPKAQILEVEFEEEDGKYYYQLEILTKQGIVRDLEIDAYTGRLLKDEIED